MRRRPSTPSYEGVQTCVSPFYVRVQRSPQAWSSRDVPRTAAARQFRAARRLRHRAVTPRTACTSSSNTRAAACRRWPRARPSSTSVASKLESPTKARQYRTRSSTASSPRRTRASAARTSPRETGSGNPARSVRSRTDTLSTDPKGKLTGNPSQSGIQGNPVTETITVKNRTQRYGFRGCRYVGVDLPSQGNVRPV